MKKISSKARTMRYILCLALLPMLLRAALLSPIERYIEGDIFRADAFEIVSTVSDFISTFALFSALGCVVFAFFALDCRARIPVLVILGTGEAVTLSLGIYWSSIFDANFVFTPYFLVALLYFAIDAAVTAAVALISLKMRRGCEKRASASGEAFKLTPCEGIFDKHPLRSAVLAAALLVLALEIISCAATTISLVTSYGAPVNMTELIYLVSPYLEAFVMAIIAYASSTLAVVRLSKE